MLATVSGGSLVHSCREKTVAASRTWQTGFPSLRIVLVDGEVKAATG